MTRDMLFDTDVVRDVGALRALSEAARERSLRRTRDERTRITSIVWEFVRMRGRILYGGSALNALIGAKEPKDAFYAVDEDADIEFYSPDPGGDVVELCDVLHERHGMERVHGREAVHLGTVTISVQFHRCCDVTYMTKTTFDVLPTMLSPCGARCTHPHVMAMDLLRMMTEPDASYWRLDKAVPRLALLERHFPLGWHTSKLPSSPLTGECLHLRKLLQILSSGSVVVGARATDFYERALHDVGEDADVDADEYVETVQLTSVEYAADVEAVRGWANGETFERTCEPFGDLLGESTRFYRKHDKTLVIEVIDAYPRCIPCSPRRMRDGGRVASSLYVLATAMACHLRAFVNGDRKVLAEQSKICTRLVGTRTESRVSTSQMCDAFEDFGMDDIVGVTECGMTAHMSARNEAWLRYSPSSGCAKTRTRMKMCGFASRSGLEGRAT